ncbi:MAG: hypothetical protein Q8Q50_08510 [Methylobacter sp.]|nr:hypothetical protein [Methylobacter sp.]
MSAENTQAQAEKIPANLNELILTGAKVFFDYGAIIEGGTLDKGITNRLNWLISDLEKMSLAAKELHSEISGGAL